MTLGLSGVYLSLGQYNKWLRAWAPESQLNSNLSDECFSPRSHLPVACVQMTYPLCVELSLFVDCFIELLGRLNVTKDLIMLGCILISIKGGC